MEEKGWGIITRWQHVACTRLPRRVTIDTLDGLDTLTVPDQTKIITASADAYVSLWDTKTCVRLQNFHPPTPDYLGSASNLLSINQLLLVPDSQDYKSNPLVYVSTECN